MKRVWKKVLCAALCAILSGLTFAFAGCGGKGGELEVFLFAQSHEVEIYEKVIERFTEETGIAVHYEIEEENYFTLLATDLQNGSAADVFYVRPGDVRAYANQKNILNLSEQGLVTEDEVKDVWKQAVDFFRYDGNQNNRGDIYALPKDYSQYILGFNKNKIQNDESVMARIQPYLYDAAKHGSWASWEGADLSVKDSSGKTLGTYKVKLPGLPGDVVELDGVTCNVVYTFDEFGALAYLCSDTGQWEDEPLKNTYGTAFWEDMCLMAYVWGNDGEFLKDNNAKVNFQSQEFIDAYQAFIDLKHKWNADSTASSKTGYDMFVEGSLVFYPVGTWDIAYFNSSSALDYEIMTWPVSNRYADTTLTERQDKWKARVDSVGYGIYSGSDKVDAAAKFIKYLSINPDVQRILVQEGAQIPNIESMAKNEYLNNEIKDASGKDLEPMNKQLLLDVAAGPAKNGHYGPTVYTYNDEWFGEFFTGAQTKLWSNTPEMTVADYCAEYAAKAQAKLNEAIELEQQQKQ